MGCAVLWGGSKDDFLKRNRHARTWRWQADLQPLLPLLPLRRGATKRVVGSMAALSGAAGLSYLEYDTNGKLQAQHRKPPGGGKLAKMAKRYG